MFLRLLFAMSRHARRVVLFVAGLMVVLFPGTPRHNRRTGIAIERACSVERVGRFVTRIRPGDKELWDRLVEEARHLSEAGVPKAQAVEHLIEVAGDNPRAFSGIGGQSTRGLHRTPGGQAVLQLLLAAASEWKRRHGGRAPRVWGRKRTPTSEETALAAMPVADGFSVLARQEPRLLAIADEAIRIAESARSAGQDELSIRAVVLDIMLRIVATDPLVGPKARRHSGDADLVTTITATQVVWAYLASIAGVPRLAP